MKKIILILSSIFIFQLAFAQPLIESDDIVEVTGVILSRNEYKRIQPVPFATVFVKNTSRGTYANYEGMFSIVVRKGEQVSVSAVGYGDFTLLVPKDHEGIYFSTVIELEPKDINLGEVVIFPWPDRDNFRAEFLAMQPTEAMQMESLADKNLNRKKMYEIGKEMGMDGRENAMYYLNKQATSYTFMGQGQPMPILNPLAWAQFFKQWQSNKKKKKDDD
jgi:hypothetical protein